MIRSVPTWYSGTRFRSTLEADWACTFDAMGWMWQYEPEALLLSTGAYYRPDFYGCRKYGFMDFNGIWTCRHHFNVGKESRRFWREADGQINWPGDLKFERVPRAPKGAA